MSIGGIESAECQQVGLLENNRIMNIDRRDFIKTAGAGALAVGKRMYRAGIIY